MRPSRATRWVGDAVSGRGGRLVVVALVVASAVAVADRSAAAERSVVDGRVVDGSVVTKAVPAPSVGPRSGDRWTVLYVGDSIAVDSAAGLRAGLPAWRVEALAFGGTAPCDWVGATFRGALERLQPDVVVLSFIGNTGTPCTDGATGWRLHRRHVAAMVTLCATAAPARCVAVGQPAVAPWVAPNLPSGEPTVTYQAEALRGRWGFVDAGAAIESPNGEFDPVHRNRDGVHLDASGNAAFAGAIAAHLAALVPVA